MVKRALFFSFCVAAGFALGYAAQAPIYAPDFYEVRLSPDMTQAQVDTTLVALADWHARAGMNYHVSTSSEKCVYKDEQTSGCIYIQYTSSMDDTTAMCDGDADNQKCGCTHVVTIGYFGAVWTANILVFDYIDDVSNHENMLHEIGHALSLRHEADCLMAPQMDIWNYPEITEKDVAQYKRYHHSK